MGTAGRESSESLRRFETTNTCHPAIRPQFKKPGVGSATSIATTVPSGATTGNVVVTVGGVASNGVSFTVTLICGETGQSGTDNENADWAFATPALREATRMDILLVYTSPEQLRAAMAEFIELYNHRRYHEGIGNVTPADVYYGRREEILKRREEQKQQTLYERFQYNLAQKNNRATGEPEVRNRSLSDGLNNSFMAA